MDIPGQGVDTASTNLSLFSVAYDYGAPGNRLTGVPIAVWSSKALVGRWWRPGNSPIEAQLANEDRLVGTLTSRLDVPLTDAVLVFDKWAYVLREIRPGEQIDVEAIDPQTVATYLRHVKAVGDKQVTPPYEPESFDIPRIVEMITAHSLAGDRSYTTLANQFQGFAELSSLVHDGRAVLLGRVQEPAATLESDNVSLDAAQLRSWTFHRYVFPVAEPADRSTPQ